MAPQDERGISEIRTLLNCQKLAVLATQGEGQPYTSLMAYAYTDDLRFLLLATAAFTRKHRNMVGDARVALLIDDRSNNEEDFKNAAALTVVGEVLEIAPQEQKRYEEIYLNRHPSLQKFLLLPATVFFKIKVQKYLLVSRFEDVIEYQIDE